jgi:hypothetical protein
MAKESNPQQQTIPVFLTDIQLAQIIGKSEQTLRNDRNNGRGFPFYKVGRSVRYRLDECLTLVEQCRVSPEAE